MPLSTLLNTLPTIPHAPGVYRMVDAQGKDLYIGKAKDLYKRLLSYARFSQLSPRLKDMVARLQAVKILITANELEALLLEASLVQRYKPPYNILLKEGRAFSYLVFSEHPFPQVYRQRMPSPPKHAKHCWGPFLSTQALANIMQCLQKGFLLRTCSDFVFSHRRRPCLQYDIKQCSAPCVQKINSQAYEELVSQAVDFLEGKTSSLVQDLQAQMQKFSQQQEYKKALILRDRIRALKHLEVQRTGQWVDIFAIVHKDSLTCIQVTSFRHGQTYGSEAFFFSETSASEQPDILTTFIRRFYEKNDPPQSILLDNLIEDEEVLKLFFKQRFRKSPHFIYPKRGKNRVLLEQVNINALQALQQHMAQHNKIWKKISTLLVLDPLPRRIEAYDNSHHQGDCAVGVMVVATPEGFMKREYRTFSMQGCDDYHMMRTMMYRRFRSPEKYSALPDLILIDGGPGHLSVVQEVLEKIFLHKNIPVIAICKSVPCDTLHYQKSLLPYKEEALLHFFQRLRDEAHRFAIHTHRRLRRKKMLLSHKT